MALTHSWIALGSNVGNSARTFERAVEHIGGLRATTVVARSANYRTPPWGIEHQPDFLNAVIEITTQLPPEALLNELQAVEESAGRIRGGSRWGPRTLDLDILLYGDLMVRAPHLMIPHPRIRERAFVLVPLADIAADLQIPNCGCVKDLLCAVDTSRIRRI